MEKHRRYVVRSGFASIRESEGTRFDVHGKNILIIADRLNGVVTKKIAERFMKEGCHVVIVSETEQDFGPGVLTVICREKQFEKIGASFEKAVESLEIVHVLLNLYTFSAGVDFISVAPEIWRNEIEKVFGMAFFSLKAVYHGLVSCKGSGCFMTVSNIGGNFGLETIKYDNLSAGINTGMVKAMAKEIKSLYCKTIDFDDVSDTKFIVDTIFKEMCVPDGVTEVSYVEKQRKSLRLIPQILPFPEQEVKKISLNEEDILLFVGGGRGIVTAFVKEILKRYHSTVIIIGRSKEPEDEEWAKMSPQEFWDYKTKYIKGMKIQHKSMPVIEIVNSYEDMQNRRKLAENIREFRKISDKVHYFSCDVSDTQEVVELENTIRNLFGGITGIINGAGILTVGRIPQKRGEQALKAIFVRGMGLYNLYYAFAQHPLKFIQNIGSIAGRFGMDGQCDYVVSCDLAAKMCRKINQIQTEYDCYTMEWTAWEELGMAALPEIQNIQRSRGLSYISVKEGVEKFLQEITYGGKEEEVVIFSSLGEQASDSYQLSALTKDMSKLSSVTDANGYVIDCKKYPFLDRVLGHSNSKLTIEKNLDLKNDLYLRNHMVAGDYVFPAVAHIELYCEMAVLLSEIKSETWYIYEICKIDLKNFIKYFPKNELKLKATMEIVQQDLEYQRVSCRLSSNFINCQGQMLLENREHSLGELILCRSMDRWKKGNRDLSQIVCNSKLLSHEKYYEMTEKKIYFGILYRNVNWVRQVNENCFVGEVVSVEGLSPILNKKNATMLSFPITMDGIGRIALIGLFHEYGMIAIPVVLKNIRIFRGIEKNEVLYSYVEILHRTNCGIEVRLEVIDIEKEIVCTLNIEFYIMAVFKDHNLEFGKNGVY